MASYTPGRILLHQHEDASTSRIVPCIKAEGAGNSDDVSAQC
jgi:hypothetical protein